MNRYRFAKQSAYSRMRDRIAEKKKKERLEAPPKVTLASSILSTISNNK